MPAPQKYKWPSRDTFLQYQTDGLSAHDVSEMIEIPLDQLRKKLSVMGISLRSGRVPRAQHIVVSAPAEYDIPEMRETVADFLARGGHIQELPAQTVPYTGRGPAHHFGREIDV